MPNCGMQFKLRIKTIYESMKRILYSLRRKIGYMRRMSQFKLFLIVVTIVVIPTTVIAGFSFNLVVNEARDRYIHSLNMGTQQMAAMLSAEMGNFLSAGKMIIAEDKLRTAIAERRSGETDYSETAEKLKQYIRNYENTCFVASSFLPRIALITRDGEVFGENLADDAMNRTELLNEIDTVFQTNRNIKWTSDAEIIPEGKTNRSSNLYLILAIRDGSTFKAEAALVMQLRVNVLASRILPNMYDYQTVIVAARNGESITEMDYLGIVDELHEWIDIRDMEVTSGRSFEKTVNQMSCVVSNYSISKTDWNLLVISNMDTYTTLKLDYSRNYLLAIGVILLISFGITFRVSERFMKPVVDLNNQMKQLQEGNLRAHIEPSSNDEIGELTRQFNDMVEHINSLIELNKRKEEEKRISDMKFLQTQINPHFIYNTLTLLRYSVLTSNADQAEKMIIALNNILRYALSGGSQYVTLNHALDWIRNYLVIANCSMQAPIDVEYSIQEGTGDCQIIRMLIQPLVENAAFHGLKNCTTTPKLRITSRTDGDDLIITIWDNGPGFDTSELNRERKADDRKSIGIENVDQRIRLYYGERYGVRFRSFRENLKEGTEAIMVIPIVKKEDGDVLINEYSYR